MPEFSQSAAPANVPSATTVAALLCTAVLLATAHTAVAQSTAQIRSKASTQQSQESTGPARQEAATTSGGTLRVRGGTPVGFVIEGTGLRVLPGYTFERASDRLGMVKGERGNTGTISCDCTGEGAGCNVTLKDGAVFCSSGGCSAGCITEIAIPTGGGDEPARPGRATVTAAVDTLISLPQGVPRGVVVSGHGVVVASGYTFRRISDLKGEIQDGERDGTGTVTCESCGGAGSCTLSYKQGALSCASSCDTTCGMVITIPSEDKQSKPARARKTD